MEVSDIDITIRRQIPLAIHSDATDFDAFTARSKCFIAARFILFRHRRRDTR